ncbi:hypothetical protein [Acinetobacter rudis]|uniref:Lipoprotein n=1 Tax=Acinetobacter rudis CIP 110305 TaxID=421052 RepID=S3NTQ1_9GAMM|nr:hypothetical protein [Acinetobacter rudis]EPF81823.1 hypothetical protein F945_00158 [Acinetobacter rudis CIP 110305]
MDKIILVTLLSLSIVGCSTLSSAMMSDRSLAAQTAKQLNTTVDSVIISNRSSSITETKFVATVDGTKFDCQIVFVGKDHCYERYTPK